MADPTFTLTTFSTAGLTPNAFTSGMSGGRSVQWGYTSVQQLTVGTVDFQATYAANLRFAAGYTPVQRLEVIVLDKNNILYNFAFFYPSNGKVPGSPIPRSGQLAPRPV